MDMAKVSGKRYDRVCLSRLFSPYLFFCLVEGLDTIFLFTATFRKR